MISSQHAEDKGQESQPGVWARLRWLDTNHLLILILFLGIFTMAVRVPTDTDTWWHIRSGQYIVETGGVPFQDPFSHTVQGKDWIDHGWLAQLGLYWIYRVTGLTGLALGLGAVVTFAFWFIYRQCEGSPYLRAFVLVLAAITSSVVWIARPQIISFCLTSIFLYVLHLYKHKGLNRLYLIPILFVLWANVHGGFIIGFILIGGYILGEVLNNLIGVGSSPILNYRQIGNLVITAIVSLVAVLANPNTYKMLTYPFFTVGIGALQDYIQEWASPNFHQLYQQPFIWLLLCALAAMALSRCRADFTDVALVGMFAYMTLMAGRNMALFALVTAPVLVRYGESALENLLEAWRRRTPWGAWLDKLLAQQFSPGPLIVAVNWALLAVIVLACGVKIYQPLIPSVSAKAIEESLPVKAVSFIETHQLPRELFNSYNWGGYLIWRLYPQYPVFIDGRTDLYDDAFIRRYLRVTWAKGDWQDTLARYKVNTILIERDSGLANFLAKTGGWIPVYTDDLASVFVRDAPENQRWTSAYRVEWTP